MSFFLSSSLATASNCLAIRDRIRVPEVGDPVGPRVLPVHVDLTGFQRLPGRDRSGQADLVVHRRPRIFEDLQRDLTENQLLGELLGADRELGAGEAYVPRCSPTTGAAARNDQGQDCKESKQLRQLCTYRSQIDPPSGLLCGREFHDGSGYRPLGRRTSSATPASQSMNRATMAVTPLAVTSTTVLSSLMALL